MKKLAKSILMLSIASLAILSSCSKEDDNAEVTDVKVEISTTPTGSVIENSIVTLNVTATGSASNKLKSISVSRSDNKVVLSKSLSGTSSTEVIVDTVGTAASYTYTVAITGEKGSPATKTVTITTRKAPSELEVPNPIPLYAQQNGAGDNPNFLRLTSPFSPYTTAEFAANKSNVNLCFYYGNSNKATISSPTDAVMQTLYSGLTWSGVSNTSLFKTNLTIAQYDAIVASNTDEQIITLASGVTTWSNTITQLEVGNVVLFKLSTGELGLIKVNGIEFPAGENPNATNTIVFFSIATSKK